MKAITTEPMKPGTTRLEDVPEPDERDGSVLVEAIAVGVWLEVHVFDRVESGAKPDLVRALGATYDTGNVADIGFDPDVIVECTGVGQVIAESIRTIGAGGIVCLTGVGSGDAA